MTASAVEIRGLRVSIPRAGHARPVLDGIDLDLPRGRVLGIIGESGSGKSVLSRAILSDLPDGAEVEGSVRVFGTDVLSASPAVVQVLRRQHVAMVFQDPRASVNPVHRISDFLTEQVVRSGILPREAARNRAVGLLERMRIRDPLRVMNQFPSELSGGMLQRVVIAAALMTDPELLVCDEATTALDVTTQAEIVGILRDLTRDDGLTLIFVTHDLELAGDLCDELFVLYSGHSMEVGPTLPVLREPRHPYTAALLRSTPRLSDDSGVRLPSIPGSVLPLSRVAEGCVFAERCAFAVAECRSEPIPMVATKNGEARCIRVTGEEAP
ncbi:ABC transporter ATP-binding protein [Microbacterium sp. CCNWLW134]|uniref:ABC transporter ATP-binding protein n=1 Tax=Microbacterium sp. CCNWLW134 TaxID=3122064 RepID=UPI00300F8DCB